MATKCQPGARLASGSRHADARLDPPGVGQLLSIGAFWGLYAAR
jgi:hypothetical protein